MQPASSLGRAFQASGSFQGRRQGYVFKLGTQGLGYYRDPLQQQPEADEEHDAAAAPAEQRLSEHAADTAQDYQQQSAGQQEDGHSAHKQAASTGSAGGSAPSSSGNAKAPAVLQKANPFLKLLKGKKVPAAAAAGGDTKRAKKGDDAGKPAYLREMERYREMSCSADTKHDRPLVK